MDFYRGEELPTGQGLRPGEHQIALSGLQHIICVTAGAMGESSSATAKGKEAAESALNGMDSSKAERDQLADLYAAGNAIGNGQGGSGSAAANVDRSAEGCLIHFRTYALDLRASGQRKPRVELQECGPSLDFVLRRRRPAGQDMLANALKRPKTSLEKNTQGKGQRKNIDTDDMGDMVGQVHVGRQDLDKLQTRKMKGLKRGPATGAADEEDDEDEGEEASFDDDEELEMEDMTMPAGDSGDDDEEEEEEEEEEPAPAKGKRQRRS